MRKHVDTSQFATIPEHTCTDAAVPRQLPNRLMTAFEVAEFVGCHEESVRRATYAGSSNVSASACAAGGSIRPTCRTGFHGAHRREHRDPEAAAWMHHERSFRGRSK
jgi:hypothetical protein